MAVDVAAVGRELDEALEESKESVSTPNPEVDLFGISWRPTSEELFLWLVVSAGLLDSVDRPPAILSVVPFSAFSIIPSRLVSAPVNAPFLWPNNVSEQITLEWPVYLPGPTKYRRPGIRKCRWVVLCLSSARAPGNAG